jgi:hypothetical protein
VKNQVKNEIEETEFVRVPGLFRKWEIPQVLEVGRDYHLEDGGKTSDGTPLLAVFRAEKKQPNAFDVIQDLIEKRGYTD